MAGLPPPGRATTPFIHLSKETSAPSSPLCGRRHLGPFREFEMSQRNRLLTTHHKPVLHQVRGIDQVPLGSMKMDGMRVEIRGFTKLEIEQRGID